MKAIVIAAAIGGAVALAFWIGLTIGERRTTRESKAATRYELHSAGVPGVVIRLDKVTGETMVFRPETMAKPSASPWTEFDPDKYLAATPQPTRR